MKKSMLSLFVVSFFAVSSYSAGTIPSKFWPVRKAAQAPGVYEDQEHVGIYNRNTGVLFDRKTGNLAGIWDSKGWLAASNINPQAGQICGLWQVETISSGAEKPLVADSRQFHPVIFRPTQTLLERQLKSNSSMSNQGTMKFPLNLKRPSMPKMRKFAGK